MKTYKNKDFGYYLLQVIRTPLKWYLSFKLKINIIQNDAHEDQGPFLIIGNHCTDFDPFITLVYLKTFVRFVAASNIMDKKVKSILLKWARVIPIEKRNRDVSTIRTLLKEVKQGNSVGLFPEGGRTWDGATDTIIYSTAKLIKMLRLPVYNQLLEGAYLSSPRWAKSGRKGTLDVTIKLILTKEEVMDLSEDEIFERMKSYLIHNDYDFQRTAMVPYKGKDLAMYVERLLYACPVCQSFNQFHSYRDDFYCKSCESKGTINQYGFIEGDFPYDNLVTFNEKQKEQLPNYINSDAFDEVFIENVPYVRTENDKNIKNLVNLIINKEDITVDYFGETEVYPIHSISQVSITFKNALTFYEHGVRHEFIIEPFLHDTSISFLHDALNYIREVE